MFDGVKEQEFMFELINARQLYKVYSWSYFRVDYLFEYQPLTGYYESFESYKSYCLN